MQIAMKPERNDALIRFSKLPGSRHQTATIDPNRKPERGCIFPSQQLRREFARAVEGQRWLRRKTFRDTALVEADWKRISAGRVRREVPIRLESICVDSARNPSKFLR